MKKLMTVLLLMSSLVFANKKQGQKKIEKCPEGSIFTGAVAGKIGCSVPTEEETAPVIKFSCSFEMTMAGQTNTVTQGRTDLNVIESRSDKTAVCSASEHQVSSCGVNKDISINIEGLPNSDWAVTSSTLNFGNAVNGTSSAEINLNVSDSRSDVVKVLKKQYNVYQTVYTFTVDSTYWCDAEEGGNK